MRLVKFLSNHRIVTSVVALGVAYTVGLGAVYNLSAETVAIEPTVSNVEVKTAVEPEPVIIEPEPVKETEIVQEKQIHVQTPAQPEPTLTIVWINGVINDGTELNCVTNTVERRYYTDKEWRNLIDTNPGYTGMIIRMSTGQFFCATFQESR